MEITSKDFEGYFEDTETQKLSIKILKYFKNSKFDGIEVKVLKNNESYYQINHYFPNFDISDMEFHEIMGKAIQEVFYNNNIRNTGQLNLIEEEAEYLFKDIINWKGKKYAEKIKS